MAANRRDITVRILPDHRFLLNEEQLDRVALGDQVDAVMSNRVEKLIWVAGDERIEYGSAASVIAQLGQRTPELHVALITKAQSGSVDPDLIDLAPVPFDPEDAFVPCVSAHVPSVFP